MHSTPRHYRPTRYTIDRFEDAGLAVLETEAGESLQVARATLPSGACEGDVVTALPPSRWVGDLRYAADPDATAQARRSAQALRASLPRLEDEGDLEL